jgi:anti-sigma regulatory factor (Ser/Thr protein kinase)
VEEPTRAGVKAPAHLLLPCRSEAVTTVRALLHRDLARWGVPEEVADGLLLATGEAVSHAVVHGSWGRRDAALVVRWSLSGERFSFSVRDRGPAMDTSRAARSRRAHPSQNRGRSLFVMHALMDRVVVDVGLDGTRILLEKLLDLPPAAS